MVIIPLLSSTKSWMFCKVLQIEDDKVSSGPAHGQKVLAQWTCVIPDSLVIYIRTVLSEAISCLLVTLLRTNIRRDHGHSQQQGQCIAVVVLAGSLHSSVLSTPQGLPRSSR